MVTMVHQDSSQPYQAISDRPLQSQPAAPPPPTQVPIPGAPLTSVVTSSDLSLNLRSGSRTTSAPSSPAKTRESLLQRVQSLTGAARDQGASILGAAVGGTNRIPPYNKDRCFTLLVIDDQNTDWSKYFRGRRLHGEYEIRVEQAEFRELSLTACESGATVSVAILRNGTKVIRSFKPDFVLIRQNLCDANENYKNLLLGFMYGNIPSVNNLSAIYNFQDKPWVFAHLLGISHRLGKENFPLIDQTYYPAHKEMISAPRYPTVVKLGHAHGGVGKARAENIQEFNDLASLAALTSCYSTAEPYIDAKYDVHIQKIANNYKAFMRKSISGNWKSNTGSAMLEQLAVTERHRLWIDNVSQLFGGLDICAIELLVAKDGREYIIELNDSALPLMGDSQEEDRRNIADLVTAKMQAFCKIPSAMTKTISRGSMSGLNLLSSPSEERAIQLGPPAGTAPVLTHHGTKPLTTTVGTSGPITSNVNDVSSSDGHQQLQRRDSHATQPSSINAAPLPLRRSEEPPPLPPSRILLSRQTSQSSQHSSISTTATMIPSEDSEDTMKNLRKTFAGIFGEM
ncbi:synapsin [Aphidius gifuensis]|nr:synapsin [Aphidius gifuensis]